MEFVLPAKFKDEAPQPRGAGVEVYQSEPGILRLYGTVAIRMPQKKKLHPSIAYDPEQSNKKVTGSPVVLSYDAPYKFYNRRNEILVEVDN